MTGTEGVYIIVFTEDSHEFLGRLEEIRVRNRNSPIIQDVKSLGVYVPCILSVCVLDFVLAMG